MAKGASSSSSVDLALLIHRIGYAGLLTALHGWPRALRVWNHFVHGEPWGFVNVVAGIGFPMPAAFAVLSVLAESLGALLLIPGLWTRWAAGIVAINFIVAVAAEGTKGDPIELPALYLLGALVLALAGPGRFSIDARR